MPRDVLVRWTEGDLRCELQTGGISGEGRLLVFRGEIIVTAESVPMGTAAYIRARSCGIGCFVAMKCTGFVGERLV